MQEHICKTCKTQFEGKYCSNCGQSIIERFNFAYIWRLLHQDLFELDRGLWRTMRDLAIRPGYMIKEYLEGKTRIYYSPVKYLVIAIGLYYVILSLGSLRGEEIYFGAPDWKEKFFMNEKGAFSSQILMDFNQVFSVLLFKNLTLYFLMLIPFLGLAVSLLFKKFNIVEHIIAISFIWGQIIFCFIPLGIIVFLPMAFIGESMIFFGIWMVAAVIGLFVYFAITYAQMTGEPKLRVFFRLLISIYLGYLLFFAFAFLVFVIAKLIFVGA